MTRITAAVTIGICCALGIFYIFPVFSGRVILPQEFHIGSLVIRYYGVFLALGTVAGFALAFKRAGRFGVTQDQAESLMLWLVVGGFVGARLYHVLSSLPYYLHHPVQIVMVREGGLSIYGTVLGGLFAVWLYRRIRRMPQSLLTLCDWLAPSVLLGQIIGRFGNFFNYELYGYPTGLPWKMYVPAAFRPEVFAGASYFHPLFLYEALGNAFLLWFLLARETKMKSTGSLFFWYVLLYNSLRFFLEFLRIDSVFYFNLRVNALVSLALVFVAGTWLFRRRHGQIS